MSGLRRAQVVTPDKVAPVPLRHLSQTLASRMADILSKVDKVEAEFSTVEPQPASSPRNAASSPSLEDFLPKPSKAQVRVQSIASSISAQDFANRTAADPLGHGMASATPWWLCDTASAEAPREPAMPSSPSQSRPHAKFPVREPAGPGFHAGAHQAKSVGATHAELPLCRISLDEPRAPPHATPWTTKCAEPQGRASIQGAALDQERTFQVVATPPALSPGRATPSCGECRKLQQELMACSTKNAKILMEQHEVLKGSCHLHELHEDAQKRVSALRRMQAELADRFQSIELELEDLRRTRAPTEAQWREEAGAWQSAYDTAKASAGRLQLELADREQAAGMLDTQVSDLRRSLDEAQWDLEDARAACGATERRVLSDAQGLEDEVAEARAKFDAEQTSAEASYAEAVTAETRLTTSCARLTASASASSSSSPKSCATISSLLATHRANADTEEQRCQELQTEVAEWHQRVKSGRDALGRLRELRQQATLRLEAKNLKKKPSTVDRSCSPLVRHGASAAEMELRARLRDWGARLQGLEDENQQLRSMQQLDSERNAVKTERLRLKAERYRTGHADLQRLYFEQNETRP